MGRTSRVAIVGAEGFRKTDDRVEITCFTWDGLANISNPSDYDAIIFYLISLKNSGVVNWRYFFEKFTVEATLEVLINSGMIVIVGDPRFWPDEPMYLPGGEQSPGKQFLSWTGGEFDWDNRPGKTKKYGKNDRSSEVYKNYIETISHWNYSLKEYRGPQVPPSLIAKVLGKSRTQFSSEVELQRLCENRYGGLVVFAIQLSIRERQSLFSRDYTTKTVRVGRIVFLPEIDKPEHEVVAMVLKDIVGIPVIVPEPSWASAIVAPGQACIDERITQINGAIDDLEAQLKTAVEARERVRRCVHLLYKLGDELEDVVRDILGLLGSEIETPEKLGKEDGWITVKIGSDTFEGVLEIKGTRRDHFSSEGLRQLMDWKTQGNTDRKKSYKGVFVGSSAIDKPITERQAPFTADWKETAERAEIVALDTRDLYQLYCIDHGGSLDRNQFWRALFRTKGVFDIRPFLEQ